MNVELYSSDTFTADFAAYKQIEVHANPLLVRIVLDYKFVGTTIESRATPHCTSTHPRLHGCPVSHNGLAYPLRIHASAHPVIQTPISHYSPPIPLYIIIYVYIYSPFMQMFPIQGLFFKGKESPNSIYFIFIAAIILKRKRRQELH